MPRKNWILLKIMVVGVTVSSFVFSIAVPAPFVRKAGTDNTTSQRVSVGPSCDAFNSAYGTVSGSEQPQNEEKIFFAGCAGFF
jgi:hypothetical protein